MAHGAFNLSNPHPYRRGHLITALSRASSLGLAALALAYFWQSPGVRPVPALACVLAYGAFALIGLLGRRSRRFRVAHDVVDALAVGLGTHFTGGLRSPVWLMLYPHVVAVSVRGGLGYGLAMGCLDAGIVAVLGIVDPPSYFFGLYALSLLWCGFTGGTVSSYLKAVQARLLVLNADLQANNERLEAALAANEDSRREQERALARLLESEERYRRLLERIQDGVAILSEGRIAYVNGALAALVGTLPEALVGADFGELVVAEDRPALAERHARWQDASGPAEALEARLQTRHGTTPTVSIKAGALEFEGRRSLIATLRDITRERHMEQEVKAHASRLAAINEIANAVNQSLTIESILGVAAQEARRIVPFDRLTIALLDPASSAIELVGVGPAGLRQRTPIRREQVAWAFRRPLAWHADAEQAPPTLLRELLADPGAQAALTLPLRSKERVVGAMCLGRASPQPFAAGDVAVMEGVASHIAIALDNARLLHAVRRRGQEFESLVEIGRRIVERLELPEILPLVTRSVNRIMGTHYCLLMLRQGDDLVVAAQEGLEPEVVASFKGLKSGDSLTGWVAREGRPLVVPEMLADPRLMYPEAVRRYGYRSLICVPLRRGQETLGTLEVVTKERRDFGNEEQDILTAFADATAVAIDHARLFETTRSQMEQLEAANERLAELDRLRQQYLRNVSHEFRTPLTVIRGYAEYLSAGGPAQAGALADAMRVIIESSDRLIDMVDTLIEVSRVEQGAAAAPARMRELDAAALLRSAVERLRPASNRKRVSVALELPEAPLEVRGDAELLQQALRHLLDNAVKYSSAGGRVVARARAGPGLALLEVEDSGLGIAAEHLPRIFEKFYMVDGGLTRRVGGTGVGLYLVQEILRLHGGRVGVKSQPGSGSVFTVELPLMPAAGPADPAA